MAQGEEPSIIDYARFYGLIRDHLEPHPLHGIAARDSLPSLELDDHPGLSDIDFAKFKIPEERLTVDAGAASLLSCIATLAKEAPSRHDDAIDTHRVRQMKNELPLLRSDHELDVLSFAARIIPDLEHEFLPFETVDEEADEGLIWPSRCYELPNEYAKKSTSEKLQVSSDGFKYLHETLRFHLEGGDYAVFEYDDLPYKKKPKVEPVSPPLLPVSPSPQPFVPSSETGHLELLFDHTSPTRQEVHDVERLLFDDDAIIVPKKQVDSSSQCSDPMLLDSESLGDIYSPLKDIKDPFSSPPTLRPPLQDRKVRVPLSPARSERPPLWKGESVILSEALPELIPGLPLPIPKPEDTSSSDIDAFFEEAIASIGIEAKRTIKQEQLQEEDTTLRVVVPVMDFSLPIAPWKASTRATTSRETDDVHKEMLKEMKALYFSNDPSKKHICPMDGKAERELKWAAFPTALGKVETQESILDDGSLAKYLAQPERVNIDTLTWKPEGLRILDELAESDEEVLAEGNFPEENNMESLIRKRKLELEVADTSPSSDTISRATKARPSCNRDVTTRLAEVNFENKKEVRAAQRNENSGSTFADSFSAMGALENFLNVRKGIIEKPKVKADHHFPGAPSTKQPILVQADTAKPTSKSIMPSPIVTPPITPCPFVVSASFLNNRNLSCQIQTSFPSAEFIERDFSLYLGQAQRPSSRSNKAPPLLSNRNLARQIQNMFPTAEYIERDFNLYLASQQRPPSKSNTAPPLLSTMADEADMILSPSTGLIWTTLQKIKQRSLPGKVARSAVRERILRASPRYERLLVMVSEDRLANDSIAPSQLDNNDCEALVEFTTFCSSLHDEVTVTFIGGGEEDLAKWIAAMMVKYGIVDQEVKLLQDETLWEVFLRRAGMNAFAAQAILGKLKAPEQPQSHEVDFGLTAFVKMTLEERLARFETLLGGRRLLNMVSKVLDAGW